MSQDPCQDSATIQGLVQSALDEVISEESVEDSALVRLQRCASKEVFVVAKRLCRSAKPTERALGAYILGQFGPVVTDKASGDTRLKRNFEEETVILLLEMLEIETEPQVLHSLGIALGHMHESRAVKPLSRLKTHPDADVRYGVVFGLSGQEDDLAIQTLIELSRDSDSTVRDWATFGLGSQLEIDTEEIRDALIRNIDDVDESTRYEALVGLAHRRDERILDRIVNELASGQVEVDSDVGEVFCPMLKAFQDQINNETIISILKQCGDCQ